MMQKNWKKYWQCVPGMFWSVFPMPVCTHECIDQWNMMQMCCCSASQHPEQELQQTITHWVIHVNHITVASGHTKILQKLPLGTRGNWLIQIYWQNGQWWGMCSFIIIFKKFLLETDNDQYRLIDYIRFYAPLNTKHRNKITKKTHKK